MTVDRAAVERSWKERGFSCGLWVDPPGQVWSDYVHDNDELVMVSRATSSSSGWDEQPLELTSTPGIIRDA